ncbi:GGDEF domain-containing protein [Mycoplasmatota bacterium WC30]
MTIEQIHMFDNNIISFLLLAILLLVIIIKKDIYDYPRKLFYRMIIVNMTLLIVEILAWAFDGINTESAFVLNYFFNCALILMEPIMASMWLSYVDYKINGSIKRLKKRIYYLHASIFAGVLLIINIFEPLAFRLDENNIYHRGPLLWFSLIFVFGLVLYTVILAIKNRKKISDSMIMFIAVFAFLPVLASFIQMFVYGLILTWSMVALGVVFAYYLIEMAGNSKDYLTKLYSRKKIEEIIRGKLENNESFSAIMIDLENFKEVNDMHGHSAGDAVLILFSQIIFITFGKKNFVSRIGGDEFLIICSEENIDVINNYKKQIAKAINETTDNPHIKTIGFSYGASVFNSEEKIEFDDIFDVVDKLMYQNKAENKANSKKIL